MSKNYKNSNEGIGDWGLGIAQSPIPNPQSPLIIVACIFLTL